MTFPVAKRPIPMTLNQAIDRLYDLNPGVVGIDGERHERRHKPLLLLAALDLIDEGLASPNRSPWGQNLRDRFTARFETVRKHDGGHSSMPSKRACNRKPK